MNSTVHEILTNPASCGKTYVFTYSYTEAKITQVANPRPKRKRLVRKPVEEWVEIPGATPAIISQETFDLAQAKLEQTGGCPGAARKGRIFSAVMSSATVVAGAIGLRAQNQKGERMLTTSPTMSARGETEWSRLQSVETGGGMPIASRSWSGNKLRRY